MLAAAARCEAAVIPWGGGTAMATGAVPSRYDVALDVTRLNARRRARRRGPDRRRAGRHRAFRSLQDHLAHRGQYLPLDPPLPDRATIGGISLRMPAAHGVTLTAGPAIGCSA